MSCCVCAIVKVSGNFHHWCECISNVFGVQKKKKIYFVKQKKVVSFKKLHQIILGNVCIMPNRQTIRNTFDPTAYKSFVAYYFFFVDGKQNISSDGSFYFVNRMALKSIVSFVQ